MTPSQLSVLKTQLDNCLLFSNASSLVAICKVSSWRRAGKKKWATHSDWWLWASPVASSTSFYCTLRLYNSPVFAAFLIKSSWWASSSAPVNNGSQEIHRSELLKGACTLQASLALILPSHAPASTVITQSQGCDLKRGTGCTNSKSTSEMNNVDKNCSFFN